MHFAQLDFLIWHVGQKHLRWFSQIAIIPLEEHPEEIIWIVWRLCLGLWAYLLSEKRIPLSLIVCVDSCRDNSTSVKGHTTIVQDERGVKVRRRANNTRFLLWLCRAYLSKHQHNTPMVSLCGLGFFKYLWKVLCSLQWPRTGKLPWKVLYQQNR